MLSANTNTMMADEWLGVIDAAALLPEERPVRLARMALTILSMTVFLFIGWAGFVSLKEVTATYGQIVPSDNIQNIQHYEGGIIQRILVKEGDIVEQGQPLMQLESAEAVSNLNQARYQRLLLVMEAERYDALIDGREPDFSKSGTEDKALLARQNEAFDNMRTSRTEERRVILSQIAQYRSSLQSMEVKQRALNQNAQLNEQEFAMAQKLVDQGYLSKVKFLEKQKELNALKGDLAMADLDADRTRSEIREYESRLTNLAANQNEESHDNLSRLGIEVAKADEAIAKYADRVARLDVMTPVHGVVKGVEMNTIGGVVAPGQKLMEIVPLNTELKVEARIRPGDIGQLRSGQPVKVKVHAFEYTHFGVLEGSLDSISATTFIGPDSSTYYKGTVKLQHQYVGKDPRKNQLVSGMTVDAEIITGERSLLDYLLKPIRNAADTAFTEK